MGSKDPAEENALQIIGHWYSCRLDRAYTPREETRVKSLINQVVGAADWSDSKQEIIEDLYGMFDRDGFVKGGGATIRHHFTSGKKILGLFRECLAQGKISKGLYEERISLLNDSLQQVVSFVEIAKNRYYTSGDLTQEDLDDIFLDIFRSPEKFAECQKNIREGMYIADDVFHFLKTENITQEEINIRRKFFERYSKFELELSHKTFRDLEARMQ